MNKLLWFLLLAPGLLWSQGVFSKERAQQKAQESTTLNINDNIQGTLLTPETKTAVPLVIMVGGSGAVDRNGNEPRSRSSHFKMLADSLYSNNIASYRYDKRIWTQMKNRKSDPNISFDDFITDVRAVLEHFKEDPRFSAIFLLGHDQGALTAMMALNEQVNGYISIAGAGAPIDKVIVSQIAQQQPGLDKVARATFDRVKEADELIEDIERDLYVIIGPQVQWFMKSWMQYDPVQELQEIDIPVLLINGDRNRQVDVAQTQLLQAAAPEAEVHIIKDMNHVLKKVGKDDIEAAKTYVNPNLPLHPELVPILLEFIAQ